MDLLAGTENGELQLALEKLTAGFSRGAVNDLSSTTVNDIRQVIAVIESYLGEPRYNFSPLQTLLAKVEHYGQTLEHFGDSSRFVSFIWVSAVAYGPLKYMPNFENRAQ